MKFKVITLFPEFIKRLEGYSIIGRAVKNKKIKIEAINLRDFGIGSYKQVDDKPYGGGLGMLLRVDVVGPAIESARKKTVKRSRVILLSPEGKKFNQESAEKFSSLDELTIVCGHYEGFDERIKEYTDEVVSIGDYILSGGEIPAMSIIDSVSRLIPGVLGKDMSSKTESFSKLEGKRIVESPQYTRPEEFKGKTVPKILLSGDHKKIEAWQKLNQREVLLDR
ncbi:MAG: tRNA (guanosine(37)-N1)-methyltransferase TrmD [Candidatus Berkelbacteria bacterium]|nr:tRNA (guanosine(37)-N1)-methyltransferase TrmD [Candidatus Berkelbacteria bacterium]